MHIDDATAALMAAGRRLGARGLISAGEGNLSIRLDAERLLITPSGRRKDELGPDDFVVIRPGHADADGDARSRSGLAPSSDLRIHLAVHAARPELGAMVHAHLPASMALTLAGEAPDPSALPETALLLPRLPLLPYGEMGSQDLADRVAAAIGGDGGEPAEAVILERHGAVAVGPDAGVAVDRLELIEVLCRTWLDALLVRAARARLDGAAIVDAPDNRSASRTVEG
jgi:L-fuculose-phosphate aldolase